VPTAGATATVTLVLGAAFTVLAGTVTLVLGATADGTGTIDVLDVDMWYSFNAMLYLHI
jgi:hypothetical protein